MSVEADGFVPFKQSFILSEKSMTIPLSRDNSLAMISGTIKDEKGYPVEGAQVTVQDITVLSGASGIFMLTIPFDKQRKSQRVKVFKQGFKMWDYETPVLKSEAVNIILKQ